MSILLDALRKSEQRERLGAQPDIHRSDPAIDSASSGRWRPIALSGLVIALLVAAAYGAWSWWNDSRAPLAATEVAASASAAPAAQPAGAPGADAAVASVAGADEKATGGAPSPRLSTQPRSPVENLSGDRPYRPAAAQTAPTPAAAVRPQAPPRQEISDSDLDAAIDQAAIMAQRRAEGRARRQAAEQQAAEESGDGSISFWQLPENVRGGLPVLKINVMVFDEDPARRFIIVGGKRYGEGDDLGSSLTVEAIQRDRALFRYGAYLFFVKQ